MNKWQLKKICSLILALVILVQCIPAQVFAAKLPGSISEDTSERNQNVTILGEVETLRQEDTKHFRLSDGSFLAVSYGMPVHYEDDNGMWQDINNSITPDNARNTYQLNRSDVEIAFSDSSATGRLLTTSRDGMAISMSLLDTVQAVQMIAPEVLQQASTGDLTAEAMSGQSLQAAEDTSAGRSASGNTYSRTSTAHIANDTASVLNLQDNQSWSVEDVVPDHLQSSLVYEEVFPNVDLMYTTYGYNIKEEIIVKREQAEYRYDFLLELDGLTAAMNEDGSVSFTDASGKQFYRIPTPYMEDDNGAVSYGVTFALHETAQGVVFTVEADAQWINSEDRVFPVKIDPSFVITAGSAYEDIYSAYTMEAAPRDTTFERRNLYIGSQPYSTTNDGRYRAFLHFNNMPEIPVGSEVVNAQLSMYQCKYVKRYCTSFPIGLYEVPGGLPSEYSSYYNWFAAMTWNNSVIREPEYKADNAIDYVMVDNSLGYRTWNLTELVKKWYVEGTENATAALVMMNEEDIDTYYYYASAAFYSYAGGKPPLLIVSYRNNTGIEPYYTYTTLGCGAAGTAYIADATGQLKVGKALLGYASAANPFSVNLVYNSDYFHLTPKDDYQPTANLGLDMNLGSGWTLDCIQKVEEETVDDTDHLKYTDGDGTIHYFLRVSASVDSTYPYHDEDGLGLKMKETATNCYLMTDDKGNEWTFTNNFLSCMKDADGNKINIIYNNNRLESITQENNGQQAITVASFAYDEENCLTSVTDAANNSYEFRYEAADIQIEDSAAGEADESSEGGTVNEEPGKVLSFILKNDTTVAEYDYDGYCLNRMTDSESAYDLSFIYANNRIASYREEFEDSQNTANTLTGARVEITYPNYSQTTYRDYGQDRTANTGDDILTHYLFDYAGRTANAYTTDNSGNVLGATNAVYTANASADKTNNRTLRTASIGVAGQQLLKNTGLESTENPWTFSGMTRSGQNPRSGLFGVKGTLAENETQTAQTVSEPLTAGNTYTLSAYVNTSGITRFDGEGIYLTVTDGTNTFAGSPVNYATSTNVDNGWVRASVTFTAQTSGEHTLGICGSGATGTFYADDFQLELGEAPSGCNLVENGSMEMNGYGWTLGAGAAYFSEAGAANSSRSMQIAGSPPRKPGENQGALDMTINNAYQDIPVNLPGTQTYVLSGWVNANAVPDEPEDLSNGEDTTKKCGLRAVLTYADSTTESHYVAFNSDISEAWQFASLTIVPKESGKTVSSIRVVCAYEGNANLAYFDNISLLREAAQTMRYDEDGNLVSVETPGMEEDVSTYENGNLIQTVTGGQGTYEYTYDTEYTHRLISVTNNLITQSMGYDGVGNVTFTTLSGTGEDSKSVSTSAQYDAAGNRLASVTDATGATVTYAYDTADARMLGLPTSVTSPNGTETTTVYDENGRAVETGIANTANLLYTYNEGNLSTVKRAVSENDHQTYNFVYDDFGNMTVLKVGGRTLATYAYGENNGPLLTQTYANGAAVSFTYDNLGRTKTATYSDGRILTYVYNGEGNVHSITESGNGTTVIYLYTYDSLGRLINSQRKDGQTTTLFTHQTYNQYNQLAGQSWQMGDSAYAESYTYNDQDGSLNTMTTGLGDTLAMGYDGLRRLSTVDAAFDRTYTYRDLNDTHTTMQVSGLSYDIGDGFGFGYTYDVMGNIATYTAPDGEVVTYTYDNQGQLLSAAGDTTYTYSYDTVGNILTANGHVYTYGNADWKDLLTAFDGETLTYDASGNPTSYYNGTRWAMTWANGRSLTRAESYAGTVDFAYDLNGLRRSKTVGNVEHNYLYAGGKLLRETYGTNTLDFFYDSNGTPYALKYNGTVYYYITSLQGDVMLLVDADGNTVASYEYDPYGKVISATGTLAEINPIRYRGYYYDSETGLYYVSSRYYDPTIGRWINVDDTAYLGADGTLLSYNLFAYCKNNPVMGYDPTGHFSWTDVFNTAAVVTIAALAVIAIVGSGGSAAPPLLAAASALAGTTVTAATATTVATGVAVTGVAVMGTAATASILESSSKQGKDYVQARNNRQANQWAQDVGFDGAEDLKDFYTDGNGSKFNMFRNRATEEIILIGFKGMLKGIEIATELFLK